MSKIYSKNIPFSTLKRNFIDCIYAVPQLQRNYVWDKKRVCLLLDSIYNHLPIGVSLIWKAKSTKVAEIKPNNKTILSPLKLNRSSIEFIIDGQQRLTSLYGIAFGINEAIDFNSKIDFRKIYFSLNKNAENKFVFLNRYDFERKEYIPVYEAINNGPKNLKKRFNLNNHKIQLIKKLKNQIQSYRFHFLYLESNSLDEIRETFIRINSQGMTVGKADALFARTTNIGLRDLVDNTRRATITRQYNEMKPESFIYTFILSKGENRVGKTALDKFVMRFKNQKQFKVKFQKEWKKYHKAFLQCIDYLADDLDVANYSQLPSNNIFTMLSLFFYLNNGRPSTAQKWEIRKWFWHTSLGERYSGGAFNKNIPNDINFFRKLAKRKTYKYVISNKINPNELFKKGYKQINSSAVKGFYLFLKSLRPRYIEVGYPMMLDNPLWLSNRKDRHHIFPTNVLNRKHIKSRWNNSLLNICFLSADENQSISDDYPHKYLGYYKTKRKKYFHSVMRSHVLPIKMDSGVWEMNTKKGFKSFLNQRAERLLTRIANKVGIKKNQMFYPFEEIKRV